MGEVQKPISAIANTSFFLNHNNTKEFIHIYILLAVKYYYLQKHWIFKLQKHCIRLLIPFSIIIQYQLFSSFQ